MGVMGVRFNTIPLAGTLAFAVTRLKDPWKVLPLFFNRSSKIHIKLVDNGDIVLRSKGDFWTLRDLMFRGWQITGIDGDLIYLQRDDINIVSATSRLAVLKEPLDEIYHVFDYENKTVLDVGGYIGYTASLFSRWGAKKIIIYEAQRENIPFIKRNLVMNGVSGEVHNVAVSDEDGHVIINYERIGSAAFGLGGPKKYKVKARGISRILKDNQIDIAKFDCEGCEYSLLSVSRDILRKVPNYVVEYHNGDETLKNKFESCGFKVTDICHIRSGLGVFKAELQQ
uniref:SAM-dependent methyltransferase n=1 Tax=uncultured euryarchaeote Alv-FOS1 TaxID=337892 RepID=Q3SAB9_9EURY|nr:SAM-dependent methyltransferase [uncultured euryarchaeote Alv-FOS1]